MEARVQLPRHLAGTAPRHTDSRDRGRGRRIRDGRSPRPTAVHVQTILKLGPPRADGRQGKTGRRPQNFRRALHFDPTGRPD